MRYGVSVKGYYFLSMRAFERVREVGRYHVISKEVLIKIQTSCSIHNPDRCEYKFDTRSLLQKK